MGIQGLSQFLRKTHSIGTKTVPLGAFAGQTICVDGHLVTHRFLKSALTLDAGLMTLYNFLSDKKRRYDIRFVIAFDHPERKMEIKGRTLINRKISQQRSYSRAKTEIKDYEAKLSQTEDCGEKRKLIELINVRKKRIRPVGHFEIVATMAFLAINGFDVIMSKGDGDKMIGRLYHNGLVDSVFSPDIDFTVLGVGDTIVSFGKKTVETRDFTDILSGLDISMDQYIRMCVFAGSDFSKLKGFGPSKAYEFVRNRTCDEIDNSKEAKRCQGYAKAVSYFSDPYKEIVGELEDYTLTIDPALKDRLILNKIIPETNRQK